jgi:transketolase
VMAFEPLVDKLKAFGWLVQRVDGNNIDAVVAAFDAAKSDSGPRPRIIVADTLMGKGVPFLERREKSHFIRVEPHEWQLALSALEAGRQS